MANIGVEDGDGFVLRLENARIEVRAKFTRARSLLGEREDTLLSQLDEIQVDYLQQQQRDVIHKNELITTREHLQNMLKGNDHTTTLLAMLAPLEAKLTTLELEHQLEISWNREYELENLMKNLGTIRTIKLDKVIHETSSQMEGKPALVIPNYGEKLDLINALNLLGASKPSDDVPKPRVIKTSRRRLPHK